MLSTLAGQETHAAVSLITYVVSEVLQSIILLPEVKTESEI